MTGRIALYLAVASSLFATALRAQSGSSVQPTVPACGPSATLNQLIQSLDEAVSGPADKDRTCFRQLLLPGARLTPVAVAADGSATPHILTVDGWIDAVRKRGHEAFYERQVKIKAETYGHIAHLWSTYEIRLTPDGKATVRGINSIQAVFDGKQWHILQLLWQAETHAEPLPEKYLP